jgi:membrane protease YdiL (CAAX protease family)
VNVDRVVSVVVIAMIVAGGTAALRARWKDSTPLGLGVRIGFAKELLVGVLIGALGMTVTVGAILGAGGARIRDVGLDWSRLGIAIVVFGGAAVLEEVIYRALMLNGLIQLTGRPMLAIIVSAAVFGVAHLTGSPHATAISVLSNALGGAMYGVAFVRTRRIWMPVGIHFAWNFVQGTIFGFPVSDTSTYSGALVHLVIEDSQWLSGGLYGPEASVLSIPARLLIIGLVVLATRSAKPWGSGKRLF